MKGLITVKEAEAAIFKGAGHLEIKNFYYRDLALRLMK